jgi:hypothetical protein
MALTRGRSLGPTLVLPIAIKAEEFRGTSPDASAKFTSAGCTGTRYTLATTAGADHNLLIAWEKDCLLALAGFFVVRKISCIDPTYTWTIWDERRGPSCG